MYNNKDTSRLANYAKNLIGENLLNDCGNQAI